MALILYRRLWPVRGISFIQESHFVKDDLMVIDITDYRDAKNEGYKQYINIPYAYLKRNYQEIPPVNIHVIATDRLELNLGLRYLKAKGFEVASYSLTKRQRSQKQKGDICCGIR